MDFLSYFPKRFSWHTLVLFPLCTALTFALILYVLPAVLGSMAVWEFHFYRLGKYILEETA